MDEIFFNNLINNILNKKLQLNLFPNNNNKKISFDSKLIDLKLKKKIENFNNNININEINNLKNKINNFNNNIEKYFENEEVNRNSIPKYLINQKNMDEIEKKKTKNSRIPLNLQKIQYETSIKLEKSKQKGIKNAIERKKNLIK